MRLMWLAERPHDLKLTVPLRSTATNALDGLGRLLARVVLVAKSCRDAGRHAEAAGAESSRTRWCRALCGRSLDGADSRSAVVASVRAVLLPAYSNFAVQVGSAILLVLCLVVLVRVAPPAAWIRLPVAPIGALRGPAIPNRLDRPHWPLPLSCPRGSG